MKRIREFFNGPGFLALAAFAVFIALMLGFITPNKDREMFLQSWAWTATWATATAVFVIYLFMLPRGAIKRFVKSEGFVGLVAIAFTALLTYLFITA
jgi:hypothetical protein